MEIIKEVVMEPSMNFSAAGETPPTFSTVAAIIPVTSPEAIAIDTK